MAWESERFGGDTVYRSEARNERAWSYVACTWSRHAVLLVRIYNLLKISLPTVHVMWSGITL